MQDGFVINSERHTRPRLFSKRWFQGLWLAWFPGKLTESNLVEFDEDFIIIPYGYHGGDQKKYEDLVEKARKIIKA